MTKRLIVAGLAAGVALMTASASAHTSYMQPNLFDTANASQVTIETSFTEDFSRPEIAVESQDFHLYRPDGRRDSYDRVTVLNQMTVLESDLTETGTYRFTTGERLGRTSLQARIDGEWRPLEPGAEAPRGVQTRQSQTATVADVYVTKGPPTTQVIGVSVGRLAIVPVTHPNSIYLDEGFSLRVTFDGAPVANQALELTRDGGGYDEPAFVQTLHTDASGALTIRFTQPGVYLLMTRKSGDAPSGAETAVRSYTTSLTFEVSR
ncbi:MAG: DUF4198 domain-containing protein [Hyphomonadaceae bacterium]|nr:DUF4198 domain-containing protein [Hyphomonadaceae bacterium]